LIIFCLTDFPCGKFRKFIPRKVIRDTIANGKKVDPIIIVDIWLATNNSAVDPTFINRLNKGRIATHNRK
jgi:hypothetical protein